MKRILSYLSTKERADMPAAPLIAGNNAAFSARIPFKDVCFSGKALARALLAANRTCNADLITVFSDVFVEAEALGLETAWSEKNGLTAIRYQNVLDIEPDPAGTGGRRKNIISASELCCEAADEDVLVCTTVKDPFSLACLTFGADLFLKNCVKEPDLNHRLLKLLTKDQIRYIKRIMETGSVPLIGAPFSSGSVISPAMFTEFSTPYISAIIAEIRKRTLPVIMHICGDTGIIAGELSQIDFDILSVDKCDMATLHVSLGSRKMLMGNLDTEIIKNDSPKDVYAATAVMLEKMLFPFIPATACDVPETTNDENVAAMVRAVRDWSRD